MAYNNETNPLGVLAQNGQFKFLQYATADDTLATINTAGYFNLSAAMMPIGSLLFIQGSDGFGLFVVKSNAAGVVDIDDGTVVGATDTD